MVDKDEFFRETTLRLCGHLDIKEALRDCSEYVGRYVPLTRMYLQVFDPNLTLLRIVSSGIQEGAEVAPGAVYVGEEQKKKWMQNWDGYTIMSESSDPWFWDHLRSIGNNTKLSVLLIRLRVGDSFCVWSLVSEGQRQYSDADAKLVLLTKKPFTIAVANALEHEEVLRLKDLLADERSRLYRRLKGLSDDMVGKQSGLKRIIAMCNQIGPLDTPVLLMGETGVGKDLLAQAVHNSSSRKDAPFISVNCGAIAETLLDSELFGHEKGAFTGAVNRKIGRFERADKGTIYLDEIGELSAQGQVRLLRVLQYKEIERVGGTKPVRVDTRIIAATNRNLEEMVQSGQFRKDLWFRLSVFPINVPPLRERKEDIPELVSYFIERKRKELKLDIEPKLEAGAIDQLKTYDWPGNVRELANIVERALIRNDKGMLRFEELIVANRPKLDEERRVGEEEVQIRYLDEVNSAHIRKALKEANGKINGPGGAAELLGIHPNTLRKRMDKLGIGYKRAK